MNIYFPFGKLSFIINNTTKAVININIFSFIFLIKAFNPLHWIIFNSISFFIISIFSLWSKCPSNDLKLLKSIYIHKIVHYLNNQNSSCPLNILN